MTSDLVQRAARPRTAPKKGSGSWILGVCVAAVVVNIPLLLAAASDRSWGALMIAVLVGPAANGVLGVVALCLTPLMKRSTGEESVIGYGMTCVFVPLVAIVLDFGVISSLGLHGC